MDVYHIDYDDVRDELMTWGYSYDVCITFPPTIQVVMEADLEESRCSVTALPYISHSRVYRTHIIAL